MSFVSHTFSQYQTHDFTEHRDDNCNKVNCAVGANIIKKPHIARVIWTCVSRNDMMFKYYVLRSVETLSLFNRLVVAEAVHQYRLASLG
jgi:hypothetical protein